MQHENERKHTHLDVHKGYSLEPFSNRGIGRILVVFVCVDDEIRLSSAPPLQPSEPSP